MSINNLFHDYISAVCINSFELHNY